MAEPDWRALDREVVEHYDAKMGIQKERFTSEQREVVGDKTARLSGERGVRQLH